MFFQKLIDIFNSHFRGHAELTPIVHVCLVWSPNCTLLRPRVSNSHHWISCGLLVKYLG